MERSLSRRDFLKGSTLTAGALALGGGLPQAAGAASAQARTQVFFSRDISIDSLLRLYTCVSQHMTDKVTIKMHTGEPNGPNILPVAWAQRLLDVIPQSRVGGGALLPKQFTQ